MNKQEKIEEIHNSLINGQHKQMGQQIDDYGLYDFFSDYKQYLSDHYLDIYDLSSATEYFADAVISYHKITNK